MKEVSVKVSNTREANKVLHLFERMGCRWVGGENPTEWSPKHTDFPYYIERDKNGTLTFGTHRTCEEVGIGYIMSEPHIAITIYTDGKKVKAVNENGETGEAECGTDDMFSLEVGTRLALDRLFKIGVGDTVVITQSGLSYSCYTDFFRDNGVPIDLAARFDYTHGPRNGVKGTVKAIHKHKDKCTTIAVVKENSVEGRVYLVDVDGLTKVR